MNSPRSPESDAGWLAGVGHRLRAWWLAKLLGTTFGMTGFFIVYFWLLRHPQFPVTVMPLTGLDRFVAFRPEALPLYLSLWVYVSLAPALVKDRRELVSCGWAALGLGVVGLGIFFFWPTAVPRMDIDWSRHPAVAFLKSADATGNACPSLHVAFAVLSACGFERSLRQMGAGRVVRGVNWLWCVGILYSTVAVRQHVVLDVIAGAVLGMIAAGVHRSWLAKRLQPAS